MGAVKISVVIPIYNVESYLKKCIESLRKQIYTDFEMILVDDGSTDGCSLICDEYAEKYFYIHAVHKQNGGLSDARNAGINIASGEYIVLVDPDDFVEATFLSDLITAKERLGADIVCSPLIYEFPNGNRKEIQNFEEVVLDSESAQACILRSKYCGVSACSKLFPKSVFHKYMYPVGKINEELRTTFLLFGLVDSIAFIPKCNYHYIQRETSISYADITINTTIDAMRVCETYIKSAKSQDVVYACVNRIFKLGGDFCKANKSPSTKSVRELQKFLRNYLKSALKDPDNSMIEKVKFCLLCQNKFSYKAFKVLQRLNNSRFLG